MRSLREWVKEVILFYIILLLMISIPIIVVFVVLSIKTIVSLRYWITAGIFIFSICLGLVIYKRRKKYKKDLQKNKEELLKILDHAIKSGHDVDISFMGGLLKISYKSKNSNTLSGPKREIILLPQSTSQNKSVQMKN